MMINSSGIANTKDSVKTLNSPLIFKSQWSIKASMNLIVMMALLIPALAWGKGTYFDQVCSIGLDDQLIRKDGTVFYYQVEGEARLQEILVMSLQLDVLRDDKVINQIKLFNNFETRPFRRGEIILIPERVILSELNKRFTVLENCEVIPLGSQSEEELL